MAKKQPTLDQAAAADLFTKTEQPAEPIDDKKVEPKAVGITAGEYKEIQAIAAELGVTAHRIMLYAMRDFLRRWRAGERPKTKTKNVLDF